MPTNLETKPDSGMEMECLSRARQIGQIVQSVQAVNGGWQGGLKRWIDTSMQSCSDMELIAYKEILRQATFDIAKEQLARASAKDALTRAQKPTT